MSDRPWIGSSFSFSSLYNWALPLLPLDDCHQLIYQTWSRANATRCCRMHNVHPKNFAHVLFFVFVPWHRSVESISFMITSHALAQLYNSNMGKKNTWGSTPCSKHGALCAHNVEWLHYFHSLHIVGQSMLGMWSLKQLSLMFAFIVLVNCVDMIVADFISALFIHIAEAMRNISTRSSTKE